MKKEISVTVTVTANDLFGFMMQHTYKSFGGIFGIIFSLGAFVLLIKTWGSVQIPYSAVLVICTLLFTVINPWMIWVRTKKQVKRNPFVCEPMTYVFGKDDISMTQGEQTASVPYDALYRIRVSKSHIYLYSDTIHANILPKSQLDGQAVMIMKRIQGKD